MQILFDITLWLLKWGTILFSPFLISFTISFIYLYFVKHNRFKPTTKKTIKEHGIIRRILIDLPTRFWQDRFDHASDQFPDYGVRLVCGEQGSGKTITVAYLLLKYQKIYPKLIVKTNFNYNHQAFPIEHWTSIVNTNNDVYGEINVIDEIQNWFNSMQSKDFPPEFLTEITQQRKQRKMILGTSQVFERVAKPIREQVSLIYMPFTFMGCITFVRLVKPIYNNDYAVSKYKTVKFFFFIHTAELRDCFDTYKKIETLKKVGFKSNNEILRNI